MNLPFFTVIVPTHRRAALLRRALASIKCQSLREVQLIVVSDVRDLATATTCHELLDEGDTFVVRSGEPGPSASRNLAPGLAEGRYVMFLDDDDAYRDGYLEQLHARLQGGALEVTFGNCMVVNERRTDAGPMFLGEAPLDLSGRYTPDIFVKNSIHMSTIAFPRQHIAAKRFDPYMRAYEDWEFMLAAMKTARVEHLDLCGVNVHEVHDETSDRRGGSAAARDFNAVVDYLYVYRRHPAPDDATREKRRQLLLSCGMNVPAYCL